ncbi:MAG: SCP2 sterol-binding domain-containing protein [Acidimicrobiales bacterium]|nr:SCP2 sterol-binding domain-containing protein [Acidimicrobiales bacterium]
MVRFLSDEWIAALDAAATSDEALGALSAGLHLVVEQEVTGSPWGDVRFHVVVDHGQVHVRPGPAPDPLIRFSQDYATAAAIATGTGSAQRAFMAGRLRVGGDLRVLLDHVGTFEQLQDVFAAVRSEVVVEEAG